MKRPYQIAEKILESFLNAFFQSTDTCWAPTVCIVLISAGDTKTNDKARGFLARLSLWYSQEEVIIHVITTPCSSKHMESSLAVVLPEEAIFLFCFIFFFGGGIHVKGLF